MRHMRMDGDDINSGLAECLERTLQFILSHREISIHKRVVVGTGKCRPGVSPHVFADRDAMHFGWVSDRKLHHAGVCVAFHSENRFERLR
jgi:hypothetical protein